jgi:cytochrome c oxidase subunit 3
MLKLSKISMYILKKIQYYIVLSIFNIKSVKVLFLNKKGFIYSNKWVMQNTQIVLPSHPYHIVDQSPWPIALSAVLLSLTTSAVLSFHGYPMGEFLLLCSFILLNWGMTLWFKDIITEASYLGAHTDKVQKGLSLGVALFIISEVFFFLSIFWAYFHSALAPAIEIGSEWPPKGIEPVNASEVPTANTTLLLSSGSAVTVTHHSLVDRLIDWANNGSVATIYMAVLFTVLQGMEYLGVSYTITDSVFGSTFYMGTGLLLLGPVYLIINNLYLVKTDPLVENSKVSINLCDKDLNNNKLPAYWVTGFSDAESSFSVRIAETTRKAGWRIMPIFSIELHIRDLSILKKIQVFFNVGSIYIRKREGRVTAIYSVQSVQALNNVIIPHFLEYPLLTQKKSDFELFKLIIDLMIKKEHLNIKGVIKIVSIRACMNNGLSSKLKKAFPEITLIKRPIIDSHEIRNPLWLTGFVDGEGCFYIKLKKPLISKTQIFLVFSISQHVRDLLLFESIIKYLNCGVIEQVYTRPDSITLVVYNFNDIIDKILPFFVINPLLSEKSLDFISFNKVAMLKKEKFYLTEEDLIMIKEIKSGMNAGRK